ncbi:TPR-like protein [Hyphopichia burtonii NRRL Y-1933]|uniref:TPR-like protein n=1 Tax=Hyphopichia burtonii NRRL Y-1933 TaxID=984485 RepID=A0A1E4RDJ5_9ASCO|nr:TPR-like protein [Hyphopichia burtonii NRRL Y-1933]ODV65338.1 TPR-like protein [Hyphopichia burtonii NRRL Y-1933]
MSSVKQLLKAAKAAIESNDPESTLEFAKEILAEEKDNYFAYLFQGKAYQLLDRPDQAKSAFERALDIQPDALVGWKGYYQLLLSGEDYSSIFQALASLIEVQIEQGLSYAGSLNDLRNYLNKHKYKSNDDLMESYLRNIIPGSRLGEIVGNDLGRPEDNLKKLIDLLKNQEKTHVSSVISKAKMKLPRSLNQQHKDHLNSLKWSIYEKSDLSHLYESFLNCCSDDQLRRKYEEELLKYKYELIECSPNKKGLFNDLKVMVDDMVLVKSRSLLVWSLYYDWMDVKNLSDLELDNIIEFLSHNKHYGLGMVFYAFLMSDISPFSKEVVQEKLSQIDNSEQNIPKRRRRRSKKNDPELSKEQEEEEKLLDSDDDDSVDLSPEDVLAMMLAGFKMCKDSVLANRIVISFLIHLKEYSDAAERNRVAIKLLADLQRNKEVDLVNSREDLLCSLAIIYTYHEAPKNFPRALQLYDRILESNSNTKAKIGKGLILIEKRNFSGAKDLLQEVIDEDPKNNEALIEVGWCQVKLGDYSSGRANLLQALEKVEGVSLNSCELRAIIRWRIAQTYILENDIDGINEAYGQLIKSLKDLKNYAPSYTSLGLLYQDHYDDKARAQKCFYKAFELDLAELTSGKYLVEDLTKKNEWDIAEILCQRVVTDEKSRRKLFSHNYEDPDKSWPFRVLGCSALNKQGDAKAIEWFQSALRMKAMDIECWIGLGEAYYNCGRFDAAARVFQHVLTMDENLWIAKFMLGTVTCETGEFMEGLELLEQALSIRPNEECILTSLYESYFGYTNQLLTTGFIGRANDSNLKTIDYIHKAVKVNRRSQILWKTLGESLRFFISVQEKLESFPYEKLSEIFENVDLSTEEAIELFKNEQYSESISSLIILSAQAAINVLPNKSSKHLRSITSYNLGLAYLEGYNVCDNIEYRTSAITHIKKSVQLESNNVSFWVALGNCYVSFNPQIAQHCFIKASTLDSRDGGIWTNIAALYLRYGDAELAQEAFMRSQSIAPTQSQSWLGHALTAQAKDEDASNLFTHAYILSNGKSPLAQLMYGLSVLDRVEIGGSDPRDIEASQEFSIANFAMQKFLKFKPNDELGLKIAITVAERCRNYQISIELGERLCKILEKNYENSESEVTLTEFAKSKTQLARLYLGIGDYEHAIENAQFTLDVLDSEEESSILSSRIVIGLSFFFNDQFGEALDEFKSILKHNVSNRIISLISQILYAYGTEDTKQAALDQLFTHIEENGSSLLVVLTLGAISIVDDLTDYLEPIKEELQGLSLPELMNDTRRIVPQLLDEINNRIGKKEQTWQRSALLFPSDYNVWRHLNSRMALTVSSLNETKQNASALSDIYVSNGRLREIQRGIMLCPDNQIAIKSLNGCFN